MEQDRLHGVFPRPLGHQHQPTPLHLLFNISKLLQMNKISLNNSVTVCILTVSTQTALVSFKVKQNEMYHRLPSALSKISEPCRYDVSRMSVFTLCLDIHGLF